jgi:hypothetical protein
MKQWRKIILFASTLVVLIALLVVGSLWNKPEENGPEATPTPGPDPIVDVDEADVSGIRIENDQGILELKATKVTESASSSGLPSGSTASSVETIEWSLVQPGNVRYSAAEIKRKIAYFILVSASAEVATGTENLGEYGLDDPTATVTITLRSGEERKVLYGNPTVGGNSYYAMLEGSDRVCTVSKSAGEAAMIRVLDLLDSDIYGGLVTGDLIRLDFARAKDSLAMTAISNGDADPEAGTESTWKITAPVESAANIDGYSRFLTEVLAIKASEYVRNAPENLAEYGLDQPDYSITLQTDTRSVKLLIGGNAGGGARYGYTDYMDAVFVISTSSLTTIDKPITELMESFVQLVSIWELSAIDIRIEDETIVCGIEDYQDKSEESNFTVNGKDANVVNSSDDSYFRSFYQSLISIFIKGIDVEAKPEYQEDIRIRYTLKEDGKVISIAFTPRDEFTYYVFKEGQYMGYYVSTEDFYSETEGNEGLLPSYRILIEAMEKRVDGVYQ